MEYKSLDNRLPLSTYGTAYGNLPGLVDNSNGFCEAYIYDRPVLMLSMSSTPPMYYYNVVLQKSGVDIINLTYDNSMTTVKYLDLSQILSTNYSLTPMSSLLQGQASFNDFLLKIDVYDISHTLLESASTTLRAVNAFNGTTSGWLPSELRMLPNLTIPLSFNPNGIYNIAYTGYNGGSTSIAFTAYHQFSDNQVITLTNSSHSLKEICVVKHVDNCKFIQLYWISKLSGSWKSFAFEVNNHAINADTIIPYESRFERMQGKNHVESMRLIARACDYRTTSYLMDILTSDYVMMYYSDTFATSPTPVVLRVSGIYNFPVTRLSDFEFSAIIKEGDWL